MDRATVTYQVAGTVLNKIIEGGHVSVQMILQRDPPAGHVTVVNVSARLGAPITRAHLFAHADHVEVERGVSDG